MSLELIELDWVSFISKGKLPPLTEERRDTRSRSRARALQGRRLWWGLLFILQSQEGEGFSQHVPACVRLTDSECWVQLLGPLPPSWIDVSCASSRAAHQPFCYRNLASDEPGTRPLFTGVALADIRDARHQDGFHPSLMRMTFCIQTVCAKSMAYAEYLLIVNSLWCFIYKLNFLTGVFV